MSIFSLVSEDLNLKGQLPGIVCEHMRYIALGTTQYP